MPAEGAGRGHRLRPVPYPRSGPPWRPRSRTTSRADRPRCPRRCDTEASAPRASPCPSRGCRAGRGAHPRRCARRVPGRDADRRPADAPVRAGRRPLRAAPRRGDVRHRRGGHLGVIGAPRAGRSTMLRAIAGVDRSLHQPGRRAPLRRRLRQQRAAPAGRPPSRRRGRHPRPDRPDGPVGHPAAAADLRTSAAARCGRVRRRRRAAPHVRGPERMPYIVVLFDRWEGFFAAYDGLDGGRLVRPGSRSCRRAPASGSRS